MPDIEDFSLLLNGNSCWNCSKNCINCSYNVEEKKLDPKNTNTDVKVESSNATKRASSNTAKRPRKRTPKNEYDVVIVGAGVVGCAVARELSRFQLKVCVLEKGADVSLGASKANSGIVHGGYDSKQGTLKAILAPKGNKMWDTMNEELNFGFRRCGSLVLGFADSDREIIMELKTNGEQNGVEGLRILGPKEIIEMEPNVNPTVKCALYCPTAGITSPYEYCIALAENAIANGVEFRMNAEVQDILLVSDGFYVVTSGTRRKIKCQYVVNCAGLHAADIAAMVAANDFVMKPRKGEYLLLDKVQGKLTNMVLFPLPSKKYGKGILVSPSFWGNLLLGPTARGPKSKQVAYNNHDVIMHIVGRARRSLPSFDLNQIITSFAGLRAKTDKNDFIVEQSCCPNFINVAGIDSPGLTSSPAVALKVVHEILGSECGLQLTPDPSFNPNRSPIIVPKPFIWDGSTDHPDPEKHIICRCERVSRAEILDCMRRGLPVLSTDAVKRRTRAGMGPCQGGYCQPRVAQLIADEYGIPVDQVARRGGGSGLFRSKRFNKEDKELLSKL